MCSESLGQEDPLEEGMAIQSSILSWGIPKDRGPLQAIYFFFLIIMIFFIVVYFVIH